MSRRSVLALVLSTALVGAVALFAGPSGASTKLVGGILPVAPNSGTEINQDAEPGLAVDGGGTFWAASNILPFAADDQRNAGGLLTGADIWKSTDGRSYKWVANPFAAAGDTTAGLAGEDTDIAAAPEKNDQGFYNIYAVSLWVGATEIAISQDGGKTWTVNSLGGIPVQDRPFVAADGPCTFYLGYHALAAYDTVVNRYNACDVTDQTVGTALDPVSSTPLFLGGAVPGLSNRLGKLVVDTSAKSKSQGTVYQPMDACPDDVSNPTVPEVAILDCPTHTEIIVGVSTDRGQTFKNYTVTKTGSKQVYIWPVTAAVDKAGNVYVAWFDGGNAYINMSKDGGKTWSKSVRINQAPARSAVYPTLGAGAAGHIFVAWYGTDRPGYSDNFKKMKAPNTPGAAKWRLWTAVSTDYGRTFTQTPASKTIHTGTLCVMGGGCGAHTGDRNLLDDFGVAVSPTTGLASVVFSNDQPSGKAGETHTDYVSQVVK